MRSAQPRTSLARNELHGRLHIIGVSPLVKLCGAPHNLTISPSASWTSGKQSCSTCWPKKDSGGLPPFSPQTALLKTGTPSFLKQTDQNATQAERLTQVTVTDASHPLFGGMFPIAGGVSPHGGTPAVVIVLPDGQHRIVPCSATDLAHGFHAPRVGEDGLPLVSARTILPVAAFVKSKQAASWEGTDDDEHAVDAVDGTRRSCRSARSGSKGVVPVGLTGSSPAGAVLGEVGSAHVPASDEGTRR